jgi:hypothetical protein
MDNHDGEEARIEPGKGRVESGNKPPGNSEEEITRIMHLARHAIYPRQLCNSAWRDDLHHPLHRIESPVFVGMDWGFSTYFQGNWGNDLRSTVTPRSWARKKFFWLLQVSQTQYMNKYATAHTASMQGFQW